MPLLPFSIDDNDVLTEHTEPLVVDETSLSPATECVDE